jgi:hypothetical protein
MGPDTKDPVDCGAETEAKGLVALCHAGRLYEVERWINEDRPLDISSATKRGLQRSLLEIAVDTGFHSMVELLAKRYRTEVEQSPRSIVGVCTSELKSQSGR